MSCSELQRVRSRRRSDLEYLDLQIGQFSCSILLKMTLTPVFFRETQFEILGTLVKNCFNIMGTPVKIWQIMT